MTRVKRHSPVRVTRKRRQAPVQPAFSLFRLRHHRHSGRYLGHAHTSYRGLAAVLISVGLALAVIQQAGADAYDVTAAVLAPLPPAATPVITSPDQNTVESSSLATISGTCPVVTPPLIVELLRQDILVGSTVCSADGTFSLDVTLVLGENIFYPRFMTITGQASGFGQPITIKFDPTNLELTGNGHASTSTPPISYEQAFSLRSSLEYVSYLPKKEVTLNLEIIGGVAPYKLKLIWGDGYEEMITVATAGLRTVVHTYTVTRPVTLRFEATDATGRLTMLSLAGQSIAHRTVLVPTGSVESNTPDYRIFTAWGIYLASVGMLLGAWLHAQHQRLFSAARPRARKAYHGGRG